MTADDFEVHPVGTTDELQRLRSDCMTLALRLYLESDNTFAPETYEVMQRWRPLAAALIANTTTEQTMKNTEFHAWLTANNACRDAVEWVADRDLATAWAECERGDWMMWLAAEANIDRRLLVLAACDCAETALVHVPAGEDRPRLAIETARAWTRGEATLYQVRASASAAAYASAAYASDASAAAYASAAAAAAASASDAAYASAASASAAYASDAYATADASADAASAASAASLKRSADLVRKRISAQTVIDAINATKDQP